MYTKSLIQQHREILNIKESLVDNLNELMDKYNVVDNIFKINERLSPTEVESGYFVPSATFDTIEEAVKNMDVVKDSVRIQYNKLFTVGRTFKMLSECSDYPQIFDIKSSQNVRQ